MPPIRPNDPNRADVHDYLVLEPLTPGDLPPKLLAAFDSYEEAFAYVLAHAKRGEVSVINVLHPDGCGCNPFEPNAPVRN